MPADVTHEADLEGGTNMLGRLGPMELILILIIVLVIFGPSKVPAIGQSLGKAIREFREHSSRAAENGGETEEKSE